jgi:hypothetical protein
MRKVKQAMRKQTKGAGLIALFVWMTACFPAFSVENPQPIGIPDAPRRVDLDFPSVDPDQELRIGLFRFHPSFKTSVQYDDNVKLSDTSETSDTLFIQEPALETHVKMGDHRLEVAYGAEIINFEKEEEENSVNHLFYALGELVFGDFMVILSEAFEDTTNRTFSENSTRDQLQINSGEVTVRYDRPRWAVEGGWRRNDLDHVGSILNAADYDEDIFVFLGGYRLFPKTLVLLEVDVGDINYNTNTTNADQTYYQIFTGLRGEVTSKLSVAAKVGYQNRQMDDVAGLAQQKDFSGFVADVDIDYRPRKGTAFRLDYVRTVRNSTFESNNFYTQDKVSVSLKKQIRKKWLLIPVFIYQRNSYPDLATRSGVTDERLDNFLQAQLGLRYQIQEWLSSGVAYNFRSRNSNLETFDYDNNRVTFDVTSVF